VLADHGVISAPITTWPLSWDSIATDIHNASLQTDAPVSVKKALQRLKQRHRRQSKQGQLQLSAGLAAKTREDTVPELRNFGTPNREEAEVTAGVEWQGETAAFKLNATYVDDPQDGKDYRADGSYAGVVMGGWSYSVSTLDRWWGPGYEGSLILSSNARPVPALSLQRMSATPFDSPWLSWLGPWQLKFFAGRLESERHIPQAKLLGLRINFKPFDSLEVGLSRTAQWGGEGRPEDADSFFDMLLGYDNAGENGITPEDQPGNQLAGWDLRWKPGKSPPLVVYMQRIGEDQAGIYPTANMYQFGTETWGSLEHYDYRLVVEYSDTSAYRGSTHDWNTAYNHASVYADGYRFYSRTIGHTIDSDSAMTSIRYSLYGHNAVSWQFVFNNGKINRDNDGQNTVSTNAMDYTDLQLSRRQPLWRGDLNLGLAYIDVEDRQTGVANNEIQAMMHWHRRF